MPPGRCGVETVQGVGSLPTLRAMVRAWPRQRRNAQPLIRSRADHTTHATAYKLSAVAAEFSGCVGGRRRNRFRTVRFHCSTFPNRTRCAGLPLGFGGKPDKGMHPWIIMAAWNPPTESEEMDDICLDSTGAFYAWNS